VLDDDNDEVEETDNPFVARILGLANLQYIQDMHLTISSDSLSG